MNKKINRIEVRQTAQKAAIRDEQNRRIQLRQHILHRKR